ncbi:PREDICTED: protein MMS22-like [Drosophila arizonae]|uniref:Protein MMS22-like n=1 Tax=Drosophila arizonae TaxID=7263 RepID=A0ABM1PTL7_DROAR|nr:PREDICTED: protein MMS22-like [Drosophila arizonae]
MDYDLFQSDDDEDILTAFLQATQKAQPDPAEEIQSNDNLDHDECILELLPEFNCGGRDTIKTHTDFPQHSFVRNGYALKAPLPRSRLEKLCFDFEPEQLQVCAVLRYVHGESCKQIQKLSAAVAGQQQLQSKSSLHAASSWYKARQQVTHYYLWLLHEVDEQHLQLLAPAIVQLRELINSCLDADTWRILYFAEHSKGNECQAPAYHFYHGALEWRLLDLCLLHKLQELDATSQLVYLSQLERTLDDLVLCASFYYRSKHSAELLHSSAFMCRCCKELWLVLQHQHPHQQLTDADTDTDTGFWPLLHRAMQRHKKKMDATPALAYHEFYAWLRLSLARLGAYDACGMQLLQPTPVSAEVLQTGCLLRQFLACQPDEQQRRVYLCLLAPLQLRWGQPDTDVICQLWECLHRSLNCNFGGQSQLDQLPLICASGSAYLERYRTLLAKPLPDDLNLSSFTLFALLLGKTLQQLPALGRGNQAQKLLGRIFSKFSAAKLLALNESGIHHVIELFLCLLLTYGEFSELAPKLREMLLCLAFDKLPPARRQLAAKGHMAVLLLHAQRRQPLDEYVSKLLAQLATVRNDTDVGGIYAATLQPIFELADDFARGEQLLLAPWLAHYIEHSAQAAQERVWQALHLLAQKLRANMSAGMWDALQQNVLPQLRVQYVSGYSTWLPQLAADFVALDRDKKLLEGLLQGAEPANTAASAQLLLHVLRDTASGGQQPSSMLIIQVWIKSLVLLNAQHEAVLALNPFVIQLEEVCALGLDADSLADREPLCAFFGALGRRAQQQEALAHVRMQLSHKLHAYVAHFDQWLAPQSRQERPELGARFYNFLAIVIYNCPTLCYVRSKPSCFFHLAMVRFLLTTQLQAGVAPEGRLPQLLHKIFPVLLQGIGRLPYRTDAYLSRTLEQLVLHWTPHFGFSSNVKLVARPYATLLQADSDGELAHYVLQHLANQFLAVQRSQAGTHVGLILTVLQQLFVGLDDLELGAEAEAQLLTLLRAVHVPLLEHVMFVGELEPSRVQVLSLYAVLVNLSQFQRSAAARDICSTDIRNLAEKHLAHCTYFYFQMLIKLAERAPQLVAPLFGFVREQAHSVELKRGAGEDVGIRKCLQRLQQVLRVG